MEKEVLQTLIRSKFNNIPTTTLQDFSEDIRMICDVQYYFSPEDSRILTDKTLDYPIIQSLDKVEIDELRNLAPEDNHSLLKNGDLVVDITDVDRVSLLLTDECSRCYADPGMFIITAKSTEHAVFTYWYLTLDEVSAYINVDPVTRIRSVPVPISSYLVSREFTKFILDTMIVESAVISNANEISDRIRMLRGEILEEIANKVGTCQ